MSRFTGAFTFADDHCLEAGLDRFLAAGSHFLDLDSLQITGLDVIVDIACSHIARHALSELAELAETGTIAATADFDALPAMGRHASAGLSPRHHRWELSLAATRGDVAKLRALAARGVALDHRFERWWGQSTLHLAATSGSVDAIDLLLAAGIPVDVMSQPGRVTPLMNATTADVARRLIAAGADLQHRSGDHSLLAYLCGRRHDDVTLAVLDAGARMAPEERATVVAECARRGSVRVLAELVHRDPEIALHLRAPVVMERAIQGGEPVLVDLLLEHGATLPDNFLERAVRAGFVPLVESALRTPEALARCGPSSSHRDAMCCAASEGNLEMMQLLLRYGVATHPSEPGETSPIHRAASGHRKTSLACLRWLVEEQAAPIDAKTSSGVSVLRCAIDNDCRAQAAYLIARGLDVSELAAMNQAERLQARRVLGDELWQVVSTKRKKRAVKKRAR